MLCEELMEKPLDEKGSPVHQSSGAFPFAGKTPMLPHFRCGYVAIAGKPNVGKSTLLNTMLSQKISIVTPKPQTTRHRVLGILSTDSHQVIFLDTPGFLKPKYLLHEMMVESAESAIAEADIVLWLVDATNPGIGEDSRQPEVLDRLKHLTIPVFLGINKVDLVHKPSLLPLIEFFSREGRFKDIVPISALHRDGTEKLLKLIIDSLPEHPPFYPLDIVSDRSERFFVAEIIREKIFLLCQEEIPYSATVAVADFIDREGGKAFVSADILVERDTQRGIVIGKHGAMLKKIGSVARKEIEDFLQRQIFLELHVKVREEWRRKKSWLERLGYKPEGQ